MKFLLGCDMLENLLDEMKADLIGWDFFVKWLQKFCEIVDGFILRVRWEIIRATSNREDTSFVEYVFSCRTERFWIIDFYVLDATLDLCDNDIVDGVDVGEEAIKPVIDIEADEAGVSVIAKHATMLPHRICLGMLRCTCVIDGMETVECHAASESVAADNDVRALGVHFSRRFVLAIHD